MAKGRDVGKTDYLGRSRVQTVNDLPSLTVQSDAHLADITNIMKQFGIGGQDMLDETALEFKDISDFTDLADALNQAKEAETAFLKLPPQVRLIFENDVAIWLDTAHDEEKRDALVEAGFIKADRSGSDGSGEMGGSGETPAPEAGEGTSAGGPAE